jgi:hypothetical protein
VSLLIEQIIGQGKELLKKGDKMSYSFDNTNTNRWAELEDHYQSMIDELNEESLESVFIPVSDFDELEVL